MRVFGITVLMYSLLFTPAVLYGDDHGGGADNVDQLAMYRVYEGKWNSVTTTRVLSGEEPVEFETKGEWQQREILAGAMIEVKGSSTMGGKPYSYMLLYGYDFTNKTPVCWFHDQQGVHSKLHGKWSEEEKQMTWSLAEQSPDATSVTIVDDLSDPDRISFTFKVEAEDGKVLMTQSGYATRSKKD